MPTLRLSHQLTFAIGGLLLLVGSLVAWNLVITQQLTEAHRSLVDTGLPAMRLEVGLLEDLSALRRMEGRYTILQDPAFLATFHDRLDDTRADLDRLEALVTTAGEAALLREARTGLDQYRRSLDQPTGISSGHVHPAVTLEDVLDRLYQASGAKLRRRQTSLETMARRTRVLGLTALVAAVLIGLGLGAFAVLRVARPLNRLRAATQTVAAREFSQPLEAAGPIEIRDLTQAFNGMAAQLGEIDRLKDEFFTGISHDLRTPLAAIGWSADLLQGGSAGPLTPKQQRLVETIQSSSQRLLALVGQIL
jgi:two-component system, NtrC family, sensor histidine kinase GlrK